MEGQYFVIICPLVQWAKILFFMLNRSILSWDIILSYWTRWNWVGSSSTPKSKWLMHLQKPSFKISFNILKSNEDYKLKCGVINDVIYNLYR